jgi:hypothetical protein
MLRMQAIESKTQPAPPEPTMRPERIIQATIFEVFARHEIGCELKAMSLWLDGERAVEIGGQRFARPRATAHNRGERS